jgi:hypothetical protein
MLPFSLIERLTLSWSDTHRQHTFRNVHVYSMVVSRSKRVVATIAAIRRGLMHTAQLFGLTAALPRFHQGSSALSSPKQYHGHFVDPLPYVFV